MRYHYRQSGTAMQRKAMEVQVIKPLQFDEATAQTDGIQRLAAISNRLVGSKALWAGVMLAEPNTASSVHHHGSLETVVYVLSGASKVRWGTRLEHEVELEPGDFVLIPPYVAHQEINESPNQPTQWVVVRSGQEAISVNLTKSSDGEYVVENLADASVHSIQENSHVQAN
jgi:uncharacterized RmlC-like cupin family protein